MMKNHLISTYCVPGAQLSSVQHDLHQLQEEGVSFIFYRGGNEGAEMKLSLECG